MRDQGAIVQPATDIAIPDSPWSKSCAHPGRRKNRYLPTMAVAMGRRLPGENEESFQQLIERTLTARGECFRSQVRCVGGRADIVSDVAVYELKCRLYPSDTVHAVGQVLMYRQAINPRLRAVIVGILDPKSEAVYANVKALGVDIWAWEWATK